jgi:hypothetical protein
MPDVKSSRMIGTSLSFPTPGQKYNTWYDFKRDLESMCGHPVLNTLWLQIKPQKALPWGKTQIRSALLKMR